MNAYITLTSQRTGVLHQRFSYTSQWVDHNQTDTREKSGNPGYIVGKPVLSGTMVSTEGNVYSFNPLVMNGNIIPDEHYFIE